MGEFYEILKVNKSKVIVVAKTYLTLGNYLSELEKDLHKIRFKGNIIFDLALSNGIHAYNRFMFTTFDGNVTKEIEPFGKQKLQKKQIAYLRKFYETNFWGVKSGILRKKDMKELRNSLEILD